MGSLSLCVTHDLMNGGLCIFFMHGNASSQYEGQFLIPNLYCRGIAVYCFDFAGCGDFISLSHFEKLDVDFQIENLIVSFGLGPFVLWGHSMGAATALLVKHSRVIVSIPDVVIAIARKMGVLSILLPKELFFLKRTIVGRADFDLSKVAPLESAREDRNVPIRFCHAVDDEFIPIEQDELTYREYWNSNKAFMRVEGGIMGKDRSTG
jgi:pimeloyl-ACP methyl ester carboxylesterase